jgi:anti-sigma B factor antagonist
MEQSSAKKSPAPVELSIAVERSGATAVVRVVGELDLASAPRLEETLQGLEALCDRVILDVGALVFMDSTGLRLALMEHERATRDGFEFVIAGARGRVRRVLRVSGVDVMVPLAPDVQAALGDGAADAS